MDSDNLTHAGAVVIRERDGVPEFLVIGALKRPQEGVLPKGHIRPNEAPEAAALRELREEAGIEGEVVAGLGVNEFDAPKEYVRAAFYLVRFLREVPAAESRRRVWCRYDEALQHLAHDDAKRLIERARSEWLQRQTDARGRANN